MTVGKTFDAFQFYLQCTLKPAQRSGWS